MKLSKLMFFGLLMTMNVVANEAEETMTALPSLTQDFFDYCSEIIPDDEEDTDNYILNCVNTQLTDSGFGTFSSINELIAHMNKEDDE